MYKIVVHDSRRVRPGDTFLAIPTPQTQQNIADAITRGASAIIHENADIPEGVESIVVPNARAFLAAHAAQLYPQQPDHCVAVTGTNGKSSTVSFVAQILTALKQRAVSLGTVGLQSFSSDLPVDDLNTVGLTTPGPIELHQLLQTLTQRGVQYLAFEASSHGLDQHRLDGVRVQAAGFTSFTQDHLDYHATLQDYRAAKMRLFSAIVQSGGTAVVHHSLVDDTLHAICKSRDLRLITYGHPAADLYTTNVGLDMTNGGAQQATIFWQGAEIAQTTIPVIGTFMLENVLCAMGLVHAFGFAMADIAQVLSRLKPVAGRLEFVGDATHRVFVDYAHSPDALTKVLETLRPIAHHAGGRLMVLFGAGGDRDQAKRPLMGQAAAHGADWIMITDDNPRSEDPAAIRAQIRAGCPDALEVADRGQAIAELLKAMTPQDIAVIAGKGHETTQTMQGLTHVFSDRAVVQKLLGCVA